MMMILLAGLVGTSFMMIIMSLIHFRKLANANMVKAIGTLFTRDEMKATVLGLVIHYSVGMGFAYLYALLWSFAPIREPLATFALILFTGLLHGIVVGALLIVEVAEHHPVKKFQKAGVPVAISHIVGHVFYGLGVGVIFSLFPAAVLGVFQNHV